MARFACTSIFQLDLCYSRREASAEKIDAEKSARAEITLAKICLALAHRVGDADAVLDVLAACRTDA